MSKKMTKQELDALHERRYTHFDSACQEAEDDVALLQDHIDALEAENALLRKLLDAAGIAAVDTNVGDGDYVADGM